MRSRQVLRETLNKIPKPESAIQNQYLLLEVLCDIRDFLYSHQSDKFVTPLKEPLREIEQKPLKPKDVTVAPWEEAGLIFHKKEPEQKDLKPIDEPI